MESPSVQPRPAPPDTPPSLRWSGNAAGSGADRSGGCFPRRRLLRHGRGDAAPFIPEAFKPSHHSVRMGTFWAPAVVGIIPRPRNSQGPNIPPVRGHYSCFISPQLRNSGQNVPDTLEDSASSKVLPKLYEPFNPPGLAGNGCVSTRSRFRRFPRTGCGKQTKATNI